MKNIKTYEEFKGQTFEEYYLNNIHIDLNLTELHLSRQSLIDLAGIQKFTNLKRLNLNENNLKNLIDLKDLKKLSYLDVTYNNITSLKGIENLTKLNLLYCYDNKLTSLDFLPNNLVMLSFANNKISSLDNIKKLINLEELYIQNNGITSLKGIENLTKLNSLYCQDNTIDWVDYIDKQGRTYYVKLPKSIVNFWSDKFFDIEDYWKFMDQNQPVAVSRKFNF